MEENKVTPKKPTTAELEVLLKDPTALVYIQFSISCAMGTPGAVVLGEQGQNELIIHEFNQNSWDKDDCHFFTLMDKLYQFILSQFILSAHSPENPARQLDSNPLHRNAHYRTAGGMGNRVILNERYEFELDKNCIYLVAGNTRTPLLIYPLSVLGPLLFPNSSGTGDGPYQPPNLPFNPEELPY